MKISIIPCYNEEDNYEELLIKVNSQTKINKEIIVIDDLHQLIELKKFSKMI